MFTFSHSVLFDEPLRGGINLGRREHDKIEELGGQGSGRPTRRRVSYGGQESGRRCKAGYFAALSCSIRRLRASTETRTEAEVSSFMV